MNTLFTNRLNGIFILNTLLELPRPVTVSELTNLINRRYAHVTAPQSLVSLDTVKRFLNDLYQTTAGTNYTNFQLVCYKKDRKKQFVPLSDVSNISQGTYIIAYLQPSKHINIGHVKGEQTQSVCSPSYFPPSDILRFQRVLLHF